MRSKSLLRALLGLSCVVAVVVLCGTQPAMGSALWTGSASNDFNSPSNWVDDDSGVSKNPVGQNLIFNATGAGYINNVQVTADISVSTFGLHKQGGSLYPWVDPTNPVTVNSDGGYTISLTSSDTALNTDGTGLGTMTVNADLRMAPTDGTYQNWMCQSDTVVNGDISSNGSSELRKVGGATLTLNGNTVVPGAMRIDAGTVTFGSSGSWTMRAYDGDSLYRPIWGTGTLNFNGTLKADVADAAGMTTGSWNVIANDTLTESYGGTFSVAMATGPSFTNNGGVWSYVDGARLWQFSQATGVLDLSQVPEPGAIVLLLTGLFGLLAYAWRKRK